MIILKKTPQHYFAYFTCECIISLNVEGTIRYCVSRMEEYHRGIYKLKRKMDVYELQRLKKIVNEEKFRYIFSR